MVLKVLVWNGSPRPHGDSMTLFREMEKHLRGEVEVISAYHGGISPCVDCRYCWEHPGCRIDDAMQAAYRKIDASDVIVLVSPVYFSQLTGPLLSVCSRLQTNWASRALRGEPETPRDKQGVVILAGGGDGASKPAEATARTVLHLMHAEHVGTVFTHNTNSIPASGDAQALAAARDMAIQVNNAYKSKRGLT